MKMGRNLKHLLFFVSFAVATISLYELLYRTVTPRNLGEKSDFRNRFMINITASDRLQCDPMFIPDFDSMSKSGYDISVDDTSVNFTVLMMSYDRLASFRQAVAHYACMPAVDRIVFLWANQKVPPPTVESFGTACPQKIVVRALPSANISLRFSPFKEIQTDGRLTRIYNHVERQFPLVTPNSLNVFRHKFIKACL